MGCAQYWIPALIISTSWDKTWPEISIFSCTNQHISLQTEMSLEPFIYLLDSCVLYYSGLNRLDHSRYHHWTLRYSCYVMPHIDWRWKHQCRKTVYRKQFRNPLPVDDSLILLSTLLSTTEINHFRDPENIKYAYEFQKLAVNQFMWRGNSSKGVLLSLQ